MCLKSRHFKTGQVRISDAYVLCVFTRNFGDRRGSLTCCSTSGRCCRRSAMLYRTHDMTAWYACSSDRTFNSSDEQMSICNKFNCIINCHLKNDCVIRLVLVGKYSQRPKTERSVFRQRRKPNDRSFELVCLDFGLFGSFFLFKR